MDTATRRHLEAIAADAGRDANERNAAAAQLAEADAPPEVIEAAPAPIDLDELPPGAVHFMADRMAGNPAP